MQLGNILSTATEPVVCKAVKFRVLGEDQQGRQVSTEAEAVLVFVSETARIEAEALAAHSLGPGGTLGQEKVYWFLMAALRDKDNPARRFCLNAEIDKFRSALIAEQVIWIKGQYDRFVQDEYPELATAEQQDELAEQALEK